MLVGRPPTEAYSLSSFPSIFAFFSQRAWRGGNALDEHEYFRIWIAINENEKNKIIAKLHRPVILLTVT